jgi:adenosylcobinamide-GDP ribazoletransferase
VRSLLALLQFCTILPLGKAADFDEFARRSYLYPLAGYVIGGIALLLVYPIQSPVLAAAVALAAVLLISGFNHFDGLLDFGDGVMAHGSREKRICALTDRQTGAGGVGWGILVTLVAFAALQGSGQIGFVILLGEVGAKLSMALLTVYGKPFHEGIHSHLHSYARPEFALYSIALCLPLLFLPLPMIAIAASFAAVIGVVVGMLLLSGRLFGGVNGDVVGAAHEITRMLVIATAGIL